MILIYMEGKFIDLSDLNNRHPVLLYLSILYTIPVVIIIFDVKYAIVVIIKVINMVPE